MYVEYQTFAIHQPFFYKHETVLPFFSQKREHLL